MCFVSPENKSLSVAKKSINDFPNKDLKEALSFKNTPKTNKFAIGLSPVTWARKFITNKK